MRHFITTLFVLFLLVFSSTTLLADKYPKNGSSFKPCPVNARMGKRAAVRKTNIHYYKPKHSGVKTYTVSSAPARSSGPSSSAAPASGGASTTDTNDNGTSAPVNNANDQSAPTSVNAPVQAPANTSDDQATNITQAPAQSVKHDTDHVNILPNQTINNTTDNDAPVQAVPTSHQTTIHPVQRVNTTTTAHPIQYNTTTTTATYHPQQAQLRSRTTSAPNTTAAPRTHVNTSNSSTGVQQSGARGNTIPVQAPASVNTNVNVNSTINNYVPVNLDLNVNIIHN